MKVIEYLNKTFEQATKDTGIEIIQSREITDGFEKAICHYYSKKETDERKLCYEKIEVYEYGFKSTCYVTDDRIDDFLLVTADRDTIYFNITENKKLAEDAKKYLDYCWNTKIDPDEDIGDLFEFITEQESEKIDHVSSPNIRSYFIKELISLDTIWIGENHKFMQIEDKIYMKIDVSGDEDDSRYDENNPNQRQKMIEYIKNILDCMGIQNIEYIVINKQKRYFLF